MHQSGIRALILAMKEGTRFQELKRELMQAVQEAELRQQQQLKESMEEIKGLKESMEVIKGLIRGLSVQQYEI